MIVSLIEHHAALLVCLDGADTLIHAHLLDDVLRPLLYMHEEYPGIKAGVITILNSPAPATLDPAVLSVYQPEEITFPLYEEEEVKGILSDRVRAGIRSDVIPSGVLDLITALTLGDGNIRVGINLLKRSVMHAEGNARTVVTGEDVRTSLQRAQLDTLIRNFRWLKEDEQRLFLHISGMKQQNPTKILTSGRLYASFSRTTPLSYTAFYTRLNKLADLRLIDCVPGAVKGNTREVLLQYDPDRVAEILLEGK